MTGELTLGDEKRRLPKVQPSPAVQRRSGVPGQRLGAPYAMIAPLLAIVIGLAIYPTVLTTVEAFFTNISTEPKQHGAGISNFTNLFNSAAVRESFVNTGLYVAFGVVLTVVLGTAIALLIERPFRGRGVVLALIMLPWGLPAVTEGVVWSWIYDPNFGVLNKVLKSIGIIGNYQVWIGLDRIESIFLTAVVQVWQITPLAVILIFAALQTIPREIYESARVDGGGWWQTVRHVTLPLIRPGLAVATVQAIVVSLNIFDQVYVLNAGATTANSIMGQAYLITFADLNFGQGYALSLIATILTVVLSVGGMRLLYRKVEY